MGSEMDGEDLEKIGVARIRLCRRRDRVSVVLGSFRDADQCIASWARLIGDPFECGVDIQFSDGLSSSYTASWAPSNGAPSVSRYVRAVALAGKPLPSFPSVATLKDLVRQYSNLMARTNADDFLARYELVD